MDCPICSKRMRIEKIEGITVDICDDHGVWLDKGEIEAIIESSKKRGEGEGFVNSVWENMRHGYF